MGEPYLTVCRTLVDEEWSPEYRRFVQYNGITSHIIPILANKDPDVYTEQEVVVKVLKILLDPDNHPILIHCNKGRVSHSIVSERILSLLLQWSKRNIFFDFIFSIELGVLSHVFAKP